MFGGNPSTGSGFGQPGLQPSKNPYATAAASKTFSGTFASNSGGTPWSQKTGTSTGPAPQTSTFGSGFGSGFGGGIGGQTTTPAPTSFAGLGAGNASFSTPSSKPGDSRPSQASAFGGDSKINQTSSSGHLFGNSSFGGSQPRAFGGPTFKCRVCSSAFQSPDELRKHIKAENHFDTSRIANQGNVPGGFAPQAGPRPAFGSDQPGAPYPNTMGNPSQSFGGFGGPPPARNEQPPYPPSSSSSTAPQVVGMGLGQGQSQGQGPPQGMNPSFGARGPRGPPGQYTNNFSSNNNYNTGGAGPGASAGQGGGQGGGPPGGARSQWPRPGGNSQDARQQNTQQGARQPRAFRPNTGLPAPPPRSTQPVNDGAAGADRSFDAGGPARQPPRSAAPFGGNTPFTPQRSNPAAAPRGFLSTPGHPTGQGLRGAMSNPRTTAHAGTPVPPGVHLSSSTSTSAAAKPVHQGSHQPHQSADEDSDGADAEIGGDDGDHPSDPDYVPGSGDENDQDSENEDQDGPGDDVDSGEEDDLNFSFSSQESGGGGGGADTSSATGRSSSSAAAALTSRATANAAPLRGFADARAPAVSAASAVAPAFAPAHALRPPVKHVSSSQLSAGSSASDSESGSSADDGSDAMGTCEDMCPAQERQKRLNESDIHKLEIPHPDMTPGRLDYADTMVKKFQRSSADHALQIPHLLRTPEALLRTIEYIESELMDRAALGVLDPRIGEPPSTLFIYLFVWDRYRMVAKDFTLQQSVLPLSRVWVECHERMARWFILMDHRMQAAGDFISAGHGQQNGESLNNLLKTLHGHYFRSRVVASTAAAAGAAAGAAAHGTAVVADFEMPNKAEFVCYFVIFQLGNGGEVSKYLQQLPEDILNSAPVRFAIEVWGALKTQNYAKYFRLLKTRATLLQACLMHRYVGEVRLAAMKKLARSLNPPGSNPQEYSLKDLTNLFMFESIPEAVEFVEHCGLAVATSSTATGGPSDEDLVVLLSGQNIDQLLPRDKNDRPIPPATYFMGEWIDQRKSARPAGSVAPSHIKGANFATHFTIAEICRGFATGGSAPVVAPAPRASGAVGVSSNIGVRAPLAVATPFAAKGTGASVPSSLASAPGSLMGSKAPSFAEFGTPAEAISTGTSAAHATTIDKAALRNKLLMSSTLSSGRGAKAATSPIVPITDADVWGPADSTAGAGLGKKNAKDSKRVSPSVGFPGAPVQANSRASPSTQVGAVPPVAAPEGSWRKKTVAPTVVASSASEPAKATGAFAFNSNAQEFAPSNGAGVKAEFKGFGEAGAGFGQVSSKHAGSASGASGASAVPAPFSAAPFAKPSVTDKFPPVPAASAAAAPAVKEPEKLTPFSFAPAAVAPAPSAPVQKAVSSSFSTASEPSKTVDVAKVEYTKDAAASAAPWAVSKSALADSVETRKAAPVSNAAPPPQAAATVAPVAEKVAPLRPPVNEAQVRAFQASVERKQTAQTLRKVTSAWCAQAAKSAALRLNRTKALYLLFWRQAHKRALQQRQSFLQDITSIKIVDSVMQGLGGMNLRGVDDTSTSAAPNALKRKQAQQTEIEKLARAAEKDQQARLSLLCDVHSTEGSSAVQQQRGLKSLLSAVGETLQVVKTCQLRSLLGLPVAASTLRGLKSGAQDVVIRNMAEVQDGPQYRGALHLKVALVSGCTTAGVACNPPCSACSCPLASALRATLANELGYGYTATSSPALASADDGVAEDTARTMSKNQLIKMKKRRGQLAKALAASNSLPCVRIGLHSASISESTTVHLSVVDVSGGEVNNSAVPPPAAKDSLLVDQVSAVSSIQGVQGAVILLDTQANQSNGSANSAVRKLFQCLQHSIPFVLILMAEPADGDDSCVHFEELSAGDALAQATVHQLRSAVPVALQSVLPDLLQGSLLLRDSGSTSGSREGDGRQRRLLACMQRALQLLAATAEPTPCVTRHRSVDWLRLQLADRPSSPTVPSSDVPAVHSDSFEADDVRTAGHAALVKAIDGANVRIDNSVAALHGMTAAAAKYAPGYPVFDFLPKRNKSQAELQVSSLPDGLLDLSNALSGGDVFDSGFDGDSSLPADWAVPSQYEALMRAVSQLRLPAWQSSYSIGAYQTQLVGYFDSLHETTALQADAAPLNVRAQTFVSSLEAALSAAFEQVSTEGLCGAIDSIVRDVLEERVAALETSAAVPAYVYHVLDEPASLSRLLASKNAFVQPPPEHNSLTSPYRGSQNAEDFPPFMSPVAGAKHLEFAGSSANYFEQSHYSQAFPTGFGRDSLFAQFGVLVPHHGPGGAYASPVADPHRTKRAMQSDSERYSVGESKGGYDVARLSIAGAWEHHEDGSGSAAFKRTRYTTTTATTTAEAGDSIYRRDGSSSSHSDRAVHAFEQACEARSPLARASSVAADPAAEQLTRQMQAEQQAADRLTQLLQQALHGGPRSQQDMQREPYQQQAGPAVVGEGSGGTRSDSLSTEQQDPMAFIEQCRREREHFDRYSVQS